MYLVLFCFSCISSSTMVVVFPKKRHCRRAFGIGGASLLLAVMIVICYTTGMKMTAWSDFVGMGAEGLEGGRAAIFPRSVPLANQLQRETREIRGAAHETTSSGGDESAKVGGTNIVAAAGGGDGTKGEERRENARVTTDKIPINKLNGKISVVLNF